MAIPNTTTFSLSDVITEVNPATPTLSSCFAAAVNASFDPSYAGVKDRLSNFRNYGTVASYAIYLSDGYNDTNSACMMGFENGVPLYILDDTVLDVGSTVYTNPQLTIPFTGGNLWYLYYSSSTYQINNSGVVIDASGCPIY